MDNFQFCSPTEFVFGKDMEYKTGEYVKKYGGTKVLLHYGSSSAVKSGLLDRVKSSLQKCNIDYVELGGVQPNPRDTLIYKGIELCRSENVDFILAVGGGSVIDSAKGISLGVPYDGDFWDFYGTDKVIEKTVPIAVVLTISAAGSEGSGDTVVTKEEGSLKRGAGSDLLRPKFSVLNPQLTCTLPAYQTACGATDIMAHVYERYITNTREVEITDRLCEAVLMTMIKETPRVIADPNNYEVQEGDLQMTIINNTTGNPAYSGSDGRDSGYINDIIESGSGYHWRNSEMYRHPVARPFMEKAGDTLVDDVLIPLIDMKMNQILGG
jgi:alcohol dehydrogenase YqhD (iron-dependent ADH family)